MQTQLVDMINDIGPGRILHTAYDTAWIARLDTIGEPIGKKALEWLRTHQNPDGSWGAAQSMYAHDRVVSTLAAMTALAQCGYECDKPLVAEAAATLDRTIPLLENDPAGETVGFELLVPMLLDEARELGIIGEGARKACDYLVPLRNAKLATLPPGAINRSTTVAFSIEMAGANGKHIVDADNLLEPGGSVARSPSATAYYALYLRPGDPEALNYLRRVAGDGGAACLTPADILVRAWVLWNLMITDNLDDQVTAAYQPHLDYLESAWRPGFGTAPAVGFKPEDLDDTAMVYEILTHFGRPPDIQALRYYEEETHFRCYDLERNPSVSTNIHALSALRAAGIDAKSPAIAKVLKFLSETRTSNACWYDKWNTSAYYTTAHAIIASAGLADWLVEPAVDWIIGTQHEDGSWGSYGPTAEETAYCLQALAIWQRAGHAVPKSVIQRGADWLIAHAHPPYTTLWTAKSLYCPELIVRSAIASALILVEATEPSAIQFSLN